MYFRKKRDSGYCWGSLPTFRGEILPMGGGLTTVILVIRDLGRITGDLGPLQESESGEIGISIQRYII